MLHDRANWGKLQPIRIEQNTIVKTAFTLAFLVLITFELLLIENYKKQKPELSQFFSFWL